MTKRLVVLIAFVLAASVIVRGTGPAYLTLRHPLDTFPRQVEGWRSIEGEPIAADVAQVLGADDYLNRIYYRGAREAVGVWVAFYGGQRQGDAIHSPMNCLPGTGWIPIAHSRPLMNLGDRQAPVNRYVVQKRGDRQLVTYWFQGRGRIVASEYANKAYLLADALRLQRTDGALVRLIAPIRGDEAPATAAIAAFATAFQPQLARWLP